MILYGTGGSGCEDASYRSKIPTLFAVSIRHYL